MGARGVEAPEPGVATFDLSDSRLPRPPGSVVCTAGRRDGRTDVVGPGAAAEVHEPSRYRFMAIGDLAYRMKG